jgi:hypothetical protein
MILFVSNYLFKNTITENRPKEGIDAVFDVYFNDRTMTNIIFLLTTSSRQELHWRPVPELF